MTIIKNGTVVTADLTYKADVRIEGDTITEIGEGLSGRHRSAHASRNAVHGHLLDR